MKEWSLDQSYGYRILTKMWKIVRQCKLAKAEERLYKLLGRKQINTDKGSKAEQAHFRHK